MARHDPEGTKVDIYELDSKSLIALHTEACNYPGRLDEAAVEKAIREYLAALGVTRSVVRLRRGWTLEDHPDLRTHIEAILLQAFPSARAARAASDASAARASPCRQ